MARSAPAFSNTPRNPSHFGSYCHPSSSGSSRTSCASMGGKGMFGEGIRRKRRGMPELDGVWDVRRTGGLLPPLYGVRKRIAGARGATLVGARALGVPFDVVGLELRYRAPFTAFVDMLEPDGESFRGRAT